MFDLDRWQEIFASIRSNILRTVLSGFTVALGLFIFVVLFGIGNGMQNAFTDAFARDAINVIQIFTGKTTVPYAGLQSDRQIVLRNRDYDQLVEKSEKNIEYSTPKYQTSMMVRYGRESGTYQIVGATDEEKFIENRQITDGRNLTPLDFERKQNVAIIGRMVQRDLMKSGNPVGKFLNMNGVMFRVVGVFSDEGGDFEERLITVPITTLQQLRKGSDTLNSVVLTYNQALSPDEAIAFGEEIEKDLKTQHKISPEDANAIRVRNNAKNTKDTFQFLFVITVIVGIIGGGTLIAGIIGISNIMVYIVKERTKEIGVRKAIGAKPNSIVTLILQESIVITVLSGLIGVGLGVLTLRLLDGKLDDYFIFRPGVGWGLIIAAFVSLIVSGAVAGFVPAYKASKIKPIEALRNE